MGKETEKNTNEEGPNPGKKGQTRARGPNLIQDIINCHSSISLPKKECRIES